MRLNVAHASLQFGLTDSQHTEDIEALFAAATRSRWAWITGTEAGPGAGNTGKELVRVSEENGYRPWVPRTQSRPGQASRFTDSWIAVREDLIEGNWETNFEEVIPGSGALYKEQGLKASLHPKWGPKGLVSVGFDNDKLGRINIGASHYLTDARSPDSKPINGVDHWEWNAKLAKAIGDWAKTVGKGQGLAFYGGDQNMADDKAAQPQGDSFMGAPLTSAWDEVSFWENTGHGCIDVIASYDGDRRVTAREIRAQNDREFFLHTDHFLVLATYVVSPRKGYRA